MNQCQALPHKPRLFKTKRNVRNFLLDVPILQGCLSGPLPAHISHILRCMCECAEALEGTSCHI